MPCAMPRRRRRCVSEPGGNVSATLWNGATRDAKSELGWDEFQAQKYRAWQHEVAMTVLARWFLAQTKLDWAHTYVRDPELAHNFEVEVLPRLSTANIRELLRAVLPLPQLTPREATALVVEHLISRPRPRARR